MIDTSKETGSHMGDKMPVGCDCVTYRDYQDILPKNREIYTNFKTHRYEVIRKRTPWLELVRCPRCDSYWYRAFNSEKHVYHMVRLSEDDVSNIQFNDRWPSLFDNRDVFWPTSDWLYFYGYKNLKDWQFNENLRRAR